MRVLVLGATGMLGHKLVQRLWDDVDIWGTVRSGSVHLPSEIFPDRSRLISGVSVEDPDSIVRAIGTSRPDTVVNCVGIVKQHPAAKDPVSSVVVNSLFPHRVAEVCAISDARLIHLSTDCVFSGRRGDYSEADAPDPDDLYGRTKLLGEVTGKRTLTLRTSMIGWQLTGFRALLEWLADNRTASTSGYRRAIFSGLSTSALADVIAAILLEHPSLWGLYHVSADPISKLELLEGIVDAFGWPTIIDPIDEPVVDRSLDSGAFQQQTGWKPPSWDDMIAGLAAEREMYERWRTT